MNIETMLSQSFLFMDMDIEQIRFRTLNSTAAIHAGNIDTAEALLDMFKLNTITVLAVLASWTMEDVIFIFVMSTFDDSIFRVRKVLNEFSGFSSF